MATRTQTLAQAKPNRLRHPDRRSVYWLDKLPREISVSTTKPELTPRLLELCRSKKFNTQVTRSPIWKVSEGALRAVASNRLCSLARPRAPAADWQPDRPLLAPAPCSSDGTCDSSCFCAVYPSPSHLSSATLTAVATPRICQLAQPKRRPTQEASALKSRPVQVAHTPCRASAHIELLATPKHNHPKYEGERPVRWLVSRAAKNYVASHRLLELSIPKERRELDEDYDPYAVSRAARSASPSPRIQQLCLPLPRKCRSS